jgi:hypothetical protein
MHCPAPYPRQASGHLGITRIIVSSLVSNGFQRASCLCHYYLNKELPRLTLHLREERKKKLQSPKACQLFSINEFSNQFNLMLILITCKLVREKGGARRQWLTPVIQVTWEAEIKRIMVLGQSGKKSL